MSGYINSLLHPLSLLGSSTPYSSAPTPNPASRNPPDAGFDQTPLNAPTDGANFTFPIRGARRANAAVVQQPPASDKPNSITVPQAMFPRTEETYNERMRFAGQSQAYAGSNWRVPEVPSSTGPSGPSSSNSNDVLDSLLAELNRRPEAVREMPWAELINLKTRTVELQIAEAKQKEREAELELARLKAGLDTAANNRARSMSNATQRAEQAIEDMYLPPGSHSQLQAQPEDVGESIQALLNTTTTRFGMPRHAREPVDDTNALFNNAMLPQQLQQGPVGDSIAQGTSSSNSLPSMTPIDLAHMMQGQDMDSLLSWLPDLPDQQAIEPYDRFGDVSNGQDRKRSLSVASGVSALHSPKKARRTGEKKVVIETSANCQKCGKFVARLMFRAPKSQMPGKVADSLRCTACQAAEQPPSIFDQATSSGTTIGTVETRKRMRGVVEVEDENVPEAQRRVWCDVCQRIAATGVVVSGDKQREDLVWMLELVCAKCDHKYQRCTDCGGGGGARIGIGKWRMKQIFQPGRKTCSLSHSRLGDRPREIGVHVTPDDFSPEQLAEVLARCKALWNEKTYSRLAVPEMLEIDLPEDLKNPISSFEDVEAMVTRNWPAREAMIRAEETDGKQFRRLLGLTWAHTRPRRAVRTIDLEDQYHQETEVGDEGKSTVIDNVRRTDVVIPASCELIGMWGAEWDMVNGSLLISNLIPFEGTDGEDSTALSVGELITKAQDMRKDANATRSIAAAKEGKQADLIRQCEHLWVVSLGNMPLVRERLADNLIKKRSFVHVDEYLTRHPDFANALKARPYGMHPDLGQPLHGGRGKEYTGKPLVLVRWLGKDFSAEAVRKIKQQEFGGKKSKTKKAGKGK